jgi:hypothetical protein
VGGPDKEAQGSRPERQGGGARRTEERASLRATWICYDFDLRSGVQPPKHISASSGS